MADVGNPRAPRYRRRILRAAGGSGCTYGRKGAHHRLRWPIGGVGPIGRRGRRGATFAAAHWPTGAKGACLV